MHIVMTYNLRTEDDESQAERFTQDYVDLVYEALIRLGHDVTRVEASGQPDRVIEEIVDAGPDLVFNLAEGTEGQYREALYPTLFEFLNIPYTGGGPELMAIGMDKRLTEELLELRGVRVPKGCVLRKPDDPMRADMKPPFMVKPNYEGSSMGIHSDSVVQTREEARAQATKLLETYPAGVEVEEFIAGREITVPFLAAYRNPLLEPVEYEVKGSEHNIMDYEAKDEDNDEEQVITHCPAKLTEEERASVMGLAAQAFSVLRTPDFGRADMRLSKDGVAYLIEVNPMPGLRPVSPVVTSARAMGMRYEEVIRWIIASAKRRYGMAADEHARSPEGEGVAQA